MESSSSPYTCKRLVNKTRKLQVRDREDDEEKEQDAP
jgi:hypothetical protein